MEYYFIDPDIPDEVKDLNGGVIAGTETPSQKMELKFQTMILPIKER